MKRIELSARARQARHLVLAGAVLALAACSHSDAGGGAGGAGGGSGGAGGGAGGGKAGQAPAGPPQVGYVVVQQSAVALPVTLAGRAVAYRTSEVRPQVTGLITARSFIEGGLVRAGQPLFQIDPRLYRAAANQAAANLSSARATEQSAAALANRYKPLVQIQAISQQDYTDAVAQAQVARAGIAQNAAALDTARINLKFTTVPAPISGRIGRSLFTVGALVTSSQTDPLAVIQQLDPMYIDIQQPTAAVLGLRRALSQNGVLPTRARVRLTLADGSDYGRLGSIELTDVTVDQSTGTVTLRALIPNPDGVLLPGMFVRASFSQAVNTRALLVPQQAVTRDPNGTASVMIVGPGDKAVQRTVTTGRTDGPYWVITGGLQGGDRVITQGLQSVKPGAQVRPVPANAPQRIAPPGADPSGAPSGGADQARRGGA